MWNLVGRVGGLLSRLPGARQLPKSLMPGPTSGVGKAFQALGGIENASLGLGAMMYGSDLLQQQMQRIGLLPTIPNASNTGLWGSVRLHSIATSTILRMLLPRISSSGP
jgi:hypothetical protein